jgi:anthranilate phosphoribosyltransferase
LRALLEGEKGAYRDITLLNAAAGLIVGGKCTDLNAGMALAENAIDSGKALKAMEDLKRITNMTVS